MMHNRNMGTHTLNNHDLEDEIKIEFDFFFHSPLKMYTLGRFFFICLDHLYHFSLSCRTLIHLINLYCPAQYNISTSLFKGYFFLILTLSQDLTGQ